MQTLLGNNPLYAALVRRRARRLLACATREVITTTEGVRLEAHWSCQDNSAGWHTRPIAVLLPGWEASAHAPYLLSLGARLFDDGFDVGC